MFVRKIQVFPGEEASKIGSADVRQLGCPAWENYPELVYLHIQKKIIFSDFLEENLTLEGCRIFFGTLVSLSLLKS